MLPVSTAQPSGLLGVQVRQRRSKHCTSTSVATPPTRTVVQYASLTGYPVA